MNYKEVIITVNPFSETATDLLSAMLGEIGFESFVVEDEQLFAYVREKLYSEDDLKNLIESYPFEA